MDRELRIGGLDGLNAAPLLWGLARSGQRGPLRWRLSLRSPAASAAALQAGEVDLALVPSIELARHPRLSVVPGIAVAARRRVRSVVLLTRGNPAALRRVALDETSRTSVALLKILLHRLHGADPRFVEQPPDPNAMMADCDGALLIADAALRTRPGPWEVHDLASMWAEWTGLPFVFALWALRPGLQVEGIGELLAASRAEGLANLPRLVAAHAVRDGNPDVPALTAYLSELLHYALGAEEKASLHLFFGEAHRLGLVPEPAPLRFCEPDAAARPALAGGAP